MCIIVNYGLGSKVVKSAKRHGFSGGTITLAKGTVNSRVLNFIGLADVRRELVYLVAEKSVAYRALEEMNKEFEFDKPNRGIVFTTSINGILGSKNVKSKKRVVNNDIEKRGDKTMYNLITVVVDKGLAEDVIDAANKAGAKGGTIINARGSGIHESGKILSMEIEPEKEIVLILSESDTTESIVSAIRDAIKIDEPGNGILFVQDVNKTYGIYK
ncbi:MAG TPA: P-II family nitrogen regulator [Fervidobacterium sp.]|nr:P-II family nitrogen regulator [Fervidobacterium sp.]HOH54188.1 P-II family nitrogen regulator [Fervidobacterium sp.]